MHPRRKQSKGVMGTRKTAWRVTDAFRQWVRGFCCYRCGSSHGVQAAHYRGKWVPYKFRGGTSLKPADLLCAPLCLECHTEQGSMGHDQWDALTGKDMAQIALDLWERFLRETPAGRRWRERHG